MSGVLRSQSRRRAGVRRRWLRGIAPAAALACGLAMLAAPAYAGVATHGPIDPGHGFPAWYDDGAGHKLQPCLDGPPLCLSALPDPTQPASVGATPETSNFPEEAFYWSAEATIPTSGGQEARLTLGQEAAFAGGVPVNGEQIAFGRVRIRAAGLVAGDRYRVTYPYGTRTFVADAAKRNINFTRDIGCGVPCDFSATGTSEIGPPFLSWDPKVAPAAPDGYLGDPTIAHVITGSPTGDNLFRIERVDASGTVLGLVGETQLFTLEGKTATGPDPIPGTPPALSNNGVGNFGAIDHAIGFPGWYTDASGRNYGLCIGGPYCVAQLPDPNRSAFVGTTAAESNFPDEAFYWMGEARVPTSGTEEARLTMAQEATFPVGSEAVAGEQIVFGRVRMRATGLEAGAKYRVTQPYGTSEYIAQPVKSGSTAGEINTTRDIGCGVPCDFSAPGHSDVGPSFLRWDPAVGPAAPDGYVGDPAVNHTVVGSPKNQNVFRIERLDANGTVVAKVAETDLFSIQGKVTDGTAPPVPAPVAGLSQGSVAFADQTVGTQSAARTVTLANTGNADLQVNGVSLGGTDARDFAIATNGCAGAPVPPGGSCTVTVKFAPTVNGPRTGSLIFTDTAADSPRSVALSGTGIGGTPATGLSATSIAFPSTAVRTTSATQTVTVKNTGTGNLTVGTVTVTGRSASEFAVVSNGCAGAGATVAPGASCDIVVAFNPTSPGAKAGSLDIASNAPTGIAKVALNGQARPK
jgi:hypothetical protein